MQILIDIPEEMYKWVNDVNKFFDDYGTSDFIDLVKNGTPLPKGHGRLIILSEDAVKKERCRVTFSRQYWISEVGLSNATVAIIDPDAGQPEKELENRRNMSVQKVIEEENKNG